ncbi:peptidase domain-containing ABC transporter [Xylanibacter muris]|uniref:Peptidase domain-containing ABC transporter n=1 Tax=Xylanibacter muris TaxID=2736290 RepID=A0ABX2AJH3_9BACT|nr:peptidase domain-containing ABC transporter [Xylanibacter muris]NPD91294.1 peptidase domain-containing ABC transporter [Xylanibacter muris]
MKKFPFCHQHDAMQCGLTCLMMICRYYGSFYDYDELEELCVATRNGVSMLDISEAATKIGYHTVCGRIPAANLKSMPLPCILHWKQNHFVVLYRIHRGKYYIADPAKGLLKYKEEEFRKCWVSTETNGEEKGIVMFIKPRVGYQSMGYTKEKNRKRTLQFLFGYIKPYRKYFGQIILGLLLGSLLQLILPFLTQAIVDVGIKQRDIGFIWLILLGQLMLTVSRTAVDFIRRWLLLHISMRVNLALISDFFIKLLSLPMTFFDTKQLGDIMQRMNDHGRVERFLTGNVLNVMFSVLTFLVFGGVLYFYSGVIFIIFIAGSVLYALWIASFLRRRKVLDYELFELQAENNSKTYEFINSMQEIKLQNCEQRRRWEWEDVQASVFEVQMKSMKLQQSQEAGSIFLNEVKNMVITVVAATAVINGDMTLGMMLAVQYIIGQLSRPVELIMDFVYSFQDVRISLERINDVHGRFPEDNRHFVFLHVEDPDLGIRFSEVNFKYDKNIKEKVLDNISLHIPKGKVTAIVGASGSGKTTLLKLLLGYYEVEEGRVMVGSMEVCELDKRWWRRQCGVVMQDGVIFSESIARNIAVDDGDIDTERMIKAAEIACIKDTVMSLPMKFDTKIGRDGMGLSQGQKQRILIARAVYKNPEYIILDEATNSLDANNERAIVDNLARFYEGRTVVVVAHRLSTVKNADQIIVMDKGRIVEQGTHESLTARHGAYYNLVRNQLEMGN